jgi:hypothetical protein
MALKVGTEDKKKVYLAASLGGVMLILLIRFLWQTFGPSPAAPPAPAAAVTVTTGGAAGGAAGEGPKVCHRNRISRISITPPSPDAK